MAKQNKVAVNLQQDFTDAEKTQARENIGAAASTDVTNKSEIKVFEGGPEGYVHKNLMSIYGSRSTLTGDLAKVAFDNVDSNVSMVLNPVNGDGGKVLTVVEHSSSVAPYYEWQTPIAVGVRSVPQYCYYRETLGWNANQGTVANNPEWNLWVSTATWYDKNDTAQASGTTMFNLLKSYDDTRVAKFGISETIQLECNAVVSADVHINARLSLKYYYAQNNAYSFVDVPWYEGQIYGFTGFRDVSTSAATRSLSQPLQLNAVADMPVSFWKDYVNNQDITDFGFVFVLKLLTNNVPSSVSTVWLCTSGKRESLSLMY